MTLAQIAKDASVRRLRKANIVYLGSAEGRSVSRESRNAVARALGIGDDVAPMGYTGGLYRCAPHCANSRGTDQRKDWFPR